MVPGQPVSWDLEEQDWRKHRAQDGPIGGRGDGRAPMGRLRCSLPPGGKSVAVCTPWLTLGAFDAVEQVAAIAKRQSSPVHRRGRTVTRGRSRETDRVRFREKSLDRGRAE